MQIDPLTIFAVGGVASLLIERFFYYKSKYKKKPNNPSYGERLAKLETKSENNEKDHKLIRDDIKKLFNLIEGIKK